MVKSEEMRVGATRTVVRRVRRGRQIWLNSGTRTVTFAADVLVPVKQTMILHVGVFDKQLVWADEDIDADGVVLAPPSRWQRLRRWIWSRVLGSRPAVEPVGELPVARTVEDRR